MASSVLRLTPVHIPVGERGYNPLYHLNSVNHCPGCHRSQWHVGRFSSECAFCGLVLPFNESGGTGQSANVISINRTSRGAAQGYAPRKQSEK